jgi:hypothetical protein
MGIVIVRPFRGVGASGLSHATWCGRFRRLDASGRSKVRSTLSRSIAGCVYCDLNGTWRVRVTATISREIQSLRRVQIVSLQAELLRGGAHESIRIELGATGREHSRFCARAVVGHGDFAAALPDHADEVLLFADENLFLEGLAGFRAVQICSNAFGWARRWSCNLLSSY